MQFAKENARRRQPLPKAAHVSTSTSIEQPSRTRVVSRPWGGRYQWPREARAGSSVGGSPIKDLLVAVAYYVYFDFFLRREMNGKAGIRPLSLSHPGRPREQRPTTKTGEQTTTERCMSAKQCQVPRQGRRLARRSPALSLSSPLSLCTRCSFPVRSFARDSLPLFIFSQGIGVEARPRPSPCVGELTPPHTYCSYAAYARDREVGRDKALVSTNSFTP